MCNDEYGFNVRNLMVNKEKSSDFIEEYKDSLLKNCSRVLDSGNYFIYTFRIVEPNDREFIKSIEANWI